MKRNFTVIRKSTRFNRAICVDEEVAESILEFLNKHQENKEKFEYIIHRILELPNMYYGDYKKLWQFGKRRITEIRLFPNGKNARIYCSEISTQSGTLYIIMAVFLPKKKEMSISKKVKAIIEKIKNYEYEYKE